MLRLLCCTKREYLNFLNNVQAKLKFYLYGLKIINKRHVSILIKYAIFLSKTEEEPVTNCAKFLRLTRPNKYRNIKEFETFTCFDYLRMVSSKRIWVEELVSERVDYFAIQKWGCGLRMTVTWCGSGSWEEPGVTSTLICTRNSSELAGPQSVRCW